MAAYYNEIDAYAAEWLRNLIKAGHIAPGDVDTRSIVDVRPDDLRGYTQCHFFAGVGVWSLGLRRAGWPDDRPAWTGSEPCQPFSSAGRGAGFADKRYLRPYWQHLIRVCRPPAIFGEQVASKDGLAWLDVIQSDLEGEGYAFGATDLCAAGFGAPHIRQRLFWSARRVAVSDSLRCARPDGAAADDDRRDGAWIEQGRRALSRGVPVSASGGLENADRRISEFASGQGTRSHQAPGTRARGQSTGPGQPGGLALADEVERGRVAEPAGGNHGGGTEAGRFEGNGEPGACDLIGGLADDDDDAGFSGFKTSWLHERRIGESCGEPSARDSDRALRDDSDGRGQHGGPGPTNGRWGAADWLLCRDGKWRPVEPGTFPLAHGAPARVGRLRAYGNAIVSEVAEEFIAAYLDAEADGFSDLGIGGLGHNGGPPLDDEDLIG